MSLSIGHHYSTIDSVGDGSYGLVYKSKDHNSSEYAIKQIPIDENEGIACLVEAIIMSTFDSPVINHAHNIFVTQKHLNIVQKLAKSDLAKHNLLIPDETKKLWLWQIACAIYAFHKVGIIHADIKPSNILYYSDDEPVKLTDFTLSVKVWDPSDTFNHQVGTYAYCAPETLIGQEWSFPIDIWALGATFYEIIYGVSLLKPQPKSNNRREIKIRYLNAIMTWLNIPIKNNLEFNEITADLSAPNPINNLLVKMLSFNPAIRPTIKDVLAHPYFDEVKHYRCDTYTNIVEYKPLSGNAMTKIIGSIKEILTPSSLTIDAKDLNQIVYVAAQIYQRLSLTNLSDLHLITCCWIASKLVLGVVVKLKHRYVKEEIIKMEKVICRHLSYCLIPITRDFYH